jgi:beta-phosphoglucomutase-like phosphatase (HAD superfamily)
VPLPRDLVAPVTTLLCDADGTLFPSEKPAFDASLTVTNALLERLGSDRRFEAAELRRISLGRNFRTLATDLLDDEGVDLEPEELDAWVERERAVVTEHLGRVLSPADAVRVPLDRLAQTWRLALVSSSALSRLDACLATTALADLFPPSLRVSAQDSLPEPTSKPDPAVYLAALELLELKPQQAVAVEDAVSGVLSAVGAGIPVVGNLAFVPARERAARARELLKAGATAVAADWWELAALLGQDDQVTARA